jgi:hypothetical protein
MSRKPLLSESQVAKWMKLANIDKNATKNFLSESKTTNKKVLKENYGMNSPMGAREDEDMGMEDDMGMGEEDGGMDIGDGSMGEEPSVVGDEEMDMDMEAGGDEGEVEFDSVDDLKTVIKDAVKTALEELGLADEMGGDEEPEMDMEEPAEEEDSMEGGDEGGDEPTEPAEDEEQLAEGLENLEILTDNEIINEVLKRVIRRLV